MRTRIPLILIAAVALIATACGTDDAEQTPSPTGASSPTAAASPSPADTGPVEGGTLVAAISSDPGTLAPMTTSGGIHTASELMYNGLIRLDENLEPQPELAESWEISPDGTTYTFALRDDVVWHDGEPFTSEDVSFTFEQILFELHGRTSSSMAVAGPTIETPDDTTVVFTFPEPYSPMMQQLDVTEAPIFAQHVYEGVEDILEADVNQDPIGTGPFQLASYTRDTEIRYERNEDYFKEDLPYLDEVVLTIIPEEQNQVVALEGGEVDWIWDTPGTDVERLGTSGDFEQLRTTRFPGGANCITTMSYNLDRPTLQNVDVRRAIALGLDQEQFLSDVEFGQGNVADAPISSGIPFAHFKDLDMPRHDTEQAETLLEEAGWVEPDGGGTRVAQGVEGVDDGTELSLQFTAFGRFGTDYIPLAQQQLSEIGVDIVNEAGERGVVTTAIFEDRDFDLNVISYCNGTDPQIGVRRMYDSTNIRPVPFTNSSGYANERVDELFDEALRTVDVDARTEVYRELSEILVAELPYYWLVESVSTKTYTADCQGFIPYYQFAEAAWCDR